MVIILKWEEEAAAVVLEDQVRVQGHQGQHEQQQRLLLSILRLLQHQHNSGQG